MTEVKKTDISFIWVIVLLVLTGWIALSIKDICLKHEILIEYQNTLKEGN